MRTKCECNGPWRYSRFCPSLEHRVRYWRENPVKAKDIQLMAAESKFRAVLRERVEKMNTHQIKGYGPVINKIIRRIEAPDIVLDEHDYNQLANMVSNGCEWKSILDSLEV